MSIKDFEGKGNSETVYYGQTQFLNKVYLALVIILISTLSFGLGRLSGAGERAGVTIEYDELESAPVISQQAQASVLQAVTSIPVATTGGEVVGSKNSTKYHYPHCSGAKLIKEANKVTFASPTAAEAAGYTLAGNCTPK